jgi:hypothetical protein
MPILNRKNMRSESQNTASRANGAKSRGPVTPAGRLASAGNRLDHGMLADAIVIEGEEPDRLAALSEASTANSSPATRSSSPTWKT